MTLDSHPGDPRTYQITIQGQLDDGFVTAFCPAGTQRTCQADVTLLSNICTDQSGIVGLVRHLHNLGCTIVSLER